MKKISLAKFFYETAPKYWITFAGYNEKNEVLLKYYIHGALFYSS